MPSLFKELSLSELPCEVVPLTTKPFNGLANCSFESKPLVEEQVDSLEDSDGLD